MTDEDGRYLCTKCYGGTVPLARARMQIAKELPLLCLPCGDVVAKQKKFTVAPMHKSNYMLFTDVNDLKGINNKGGFHR